MTRISSETHIMRVIDREGDNRGGLELIEIAPREGKAPTERFYIVAHNTETGVVASYLPQDRPRGGADCWTARYTVKGIHYVANPMTWDRAADEWRRWTGRDVKYDE